MYKVLWIDDEYNSTGRDFLGFAQQYDVEIIAFASHEEGIGYLEQDIEYIDAVILDAKVKHLKDDNVTRLSGLTASRDRLIEIQNHTYLPFFIFTGQPDYQRSEMFRESYGEFYIKGTDEEKLINDIIKSVAGKEEFILRKKYQKLLDTCTDEVIGTDYFQKIFALIKHIESNEHIPNSEDLFLPIRKIVERMFTRMAEKDIIPKEITESRGWLTRSSLFLSNKHSDYEHLSEIAPSIICENIHRLLNTTQDASHGEGELKLKVDQYLKTAHSDYLYRSIVYLLFDLLLWFQGYMENNSDNEVNKARWRNKVSLGDWINGTVTKIALNGYGTFQPDNSRDSITIPPEIVEDYNLKENDSIKVITKPSPDGTKIYIKEIYRD
jgi:hypothetical protein